jgi:hypothetical protein
MKNIITVILVVIAATAFAQKTIKLKVAYQPDHSYNITTKNIMTMLMDAQVDDATREQLKSQGMVFPMKMDMTQDMESTMRTGQFNDKKEVPVTVEYTKFDSKQKMSGNEMPSPPNVLKGMKASGWADSKGKLRFENIEGDGVTPEVKKLMTSMVDQMGTQILFPEKPLKVGDEFTQEIPFNMPVQGGVELKMIIKTIYKLTSFTAENAFFDTDILMTMDLSGEKASMSAEGAGKGKMVFDIKKSFMSTYDSNMDMKMKMNMGPMAMDIKATTQSQQVVKHP